VWLQPRLAAVEEMLGSSERAAALEAGRHLDRRGFMRLLADAEQRVAEPPGSAMLPTD
jgi:hypothetical protein